MTTIGWRNATSGSWSLGARWNYGLAPLAADDALIALPGAFVVTIDAAASAASLTFNAPGATLRQTTGSLTLAHNLTVESGTVALSGVNSIGGEVVIYGGVVSAGSAGALGSADVSMFGGELAAPTSVTLANTISLSGDDEIAAAAGATLTLTGDALLLNKNTTIVAGGNGATGDIVWQAGSFSLGSGASVQLDVRSGKLTFANFDDGLAYVGDAWTTIDVEAGATLDLGGSPTAVGQLSGAGVIMSVGGFGENLIVGGGQFTGAIEDGIGLTLKGDLTLAGVSDLDGISIALGDSLTNATGGILHFDSDGSITPATSGSAYVLNDGQFLRGGNSGNSSVVSAVFLNQGYMADTGGAMRFTGGFYNSGVVEGVLTVNTDGSTTWTADAPGAPLTFTGSSNDDLFSLSAAPGHVDGLGGDDTIDVEASMVFAAGSVVNVERFVISDGTHVDLSALTGVETVVLASSPGGGASVKGTSGSDAFIAESGNDKITFGSNSNSVTLDASNGAWDTVTGSNGAIFLDDAQTSIVGGGDTIHFVSGSANAVSLYATNGAWDTIWGGGGEAILNGAQASLLGGGETVYLNGKSGNAVSLYLTGAAYDSVYGSNATVNLSNARATVTGAGDTVTFAAAANDAATLAGTSGGWDNVQGAGAQVTLYGAQANFTGGGDVIYFAGGGANAASLYGTNGVWDTVYGGGASVTLTNSQANLMNAGDYVYFNGDLGDGVSAYAGSDLFAFGATLGVNWIGGFAASDKMQFAKSDFANFSALLAHASQSGSDTLIRLDGNDSVTLSGVALSSLTAGQFTFV